LVHGYALAFKFVFATHELDERNWCFDFGGLKPVKAWLKQMFDHTLLIAEDDPERTTLEGLADKGLADVRVLPAVGCEATARYVHAYVSPLCRGTDRRARVARKRRSPRTQRKLSRLRAS
jgi:6-pyruvoyltetrahydropterin/6-carboxytetrahydropterin synthase